jgi:hypothetical protein
MKLVMNVLTCILMNEWNEWDLVNWCCQPYVLWWMNQMNGLTIIVVNH